MFFNKLSQSFFSNTEIHRCFFNGYMATDVFLLTREERRTLKNFLAAMPFVMPVLLCIAIVNSTTKIELVKNSAAHSSGQITVNALVIIIIRATVKKIVVVPNMLPLQMTTDYQ